VSSTERFEAYITTTISHTNRSLDEQKIRNFGEQAPSKTSEIKQFIKQIEKHRTKGLIKSEKILLFSVTFPSLRFTSTQPATKLAHG
jgi:hypothetical protein